MTINLEEVNRKLKSERRAKQSAVPVSTEVKELAVKKARLEVAVGQLQRQVAKHIVSKPTVPPAKASAAPQSLGKLPPAKPAAKKLASKTIVIDGKTVALGPGEEFISLVIPRPKKKI